MTTTKRKEFMKTIEENFGIEQVKERWAKFGFSIENAILAKEKYEQWTKEKINFDQLDLAIVGDPFGLFPSRLEGFVKGFLAAKGGGR